jgi:hypothetical protein
LKGLDKFDGKMAVLHFVAHSLNAAIAIASTEQAITVAKITPKAATGDSAISNWGREFRSRKVQMSIAISTVLRLRHSHGTLNRTCSFSLPFQRARSAMPHLTHAHQELFRRSPDERFASMTELFQHCLEQRKRSCEHWKPPGQLLPEVLQHHAGLNLGTDGAFLMNDWSFAQLCSLARVNKETVNRLSPETAVQVFRETLPSGSKPLQVLADGQSIRSVHAASYTRLWNLELLSLVREFATDFQPPQEASTGGTGLYADEQDMFVFLIDPAGWTEIGGQAFAPGCFLWNSEVGRRSVGISTFWFQAVCQNHIVWDAVEVVEFSRKHTANVSDALLEIRRTLEGLVTKRDQRKDGFVRVIENAMREKLGADAEEALKLLGQNGIQRKLAQQALEIAKQQGRLTIFSIVDALTRLAGQQANAGDRLQVDQQAASLLQLAIN